MCVCVCSLYKQVPATNLGIFSFFLRENKKQTNNKNTAKDIVKLCYVIFYLLLEFRLVSLMFILSAFTYRSLPTLFYFEQFFT